MINHIRTPLELWLILERAYSNYYYESGKRMKITTVIDLVFIEKEINTREFNFFNGIVLFGKKKIRPRELYLKRTIQKQILKIIRNDS